MIGKRFLWLGLAALLVAVFAAPSGASALMLNYKGGGIVKPIPFELEGALNVTTVTGNGMDCLAKTTVTAETEDAKVTGIHIVAASCKGTGATKGCTVTTYTETNLPWTTDLVGTGFTVTDMTIDYNMICGVSSVKISFEKATATADNVKAIKAVTLSGTGTSGGESATVSGEFTVLGENSGAFSIVE